jgi:hypothetical protein
MNVKRLSLAILAGFVVIFLTDWLIHGVWLTPDYNATKALWRPEAEMNARVHWMFFAQFLCVATFVIIWATGFAGESVGTASVYGLLMGLFQQVWAIVDYVVIPMPPELAMKWFFSGLAQAVLLGIVTALIYKPRTVPVM